MATNDNGTSGSPDAVDLDRLIGELETEAARRRADPGYPHDADARLHFELARMAPNPRRAVPVQEVVAQLEDRCRAPDHGRRPRYRSGSPAARPSGLGRARRAARGSAARRDDGQRRGPTRRGGAARGLERGERLEPIDEGARRGETGIVTDTARRPGPAIGESGAWAVWQSRLAEPLVDGERVLYAQSEPEVVVATLPRRGFRCLCRGGGGHA